MLRSRPLARTIVLYLIPSVVLLVLVRNYGSDLWVRIVDEHLPELKSPDGSHKDLPWKLALSFFWVAVSLIVLRGISYWLGPSRAKRRSRPEMPALLRDLIRYGAVIFLIALILRAIWGDEVSPIIGALGIGGVVLGFALQETLSNFFAGLALLAEQPFGQGDWIRIGDRAEGQVEHVTWRATKIRTRDNDYLIFPNSMVAKEVINNYRLPSVVHAVRIDIGTSYDDPPDLVKRVLLEVVAGVTAVLKSPPPVVYLKTYADFSINYQLKCFIEDYDRLPVIQDDILNRIWYAFRREGIEIPFPIRTLQVERLHRSGPRKGTVDVPAVLRRVPFFEPFSDEEIASLADRSGVLWFGKGERIIRQGDSGDTLYAIASGTARVTLRTEGENERTVATLEAPAVFGEMSLLTGDPRTANIYAEDGIVLIAVSKDAFLPLLERHPESAERVAEIVTLRKQGLDRAHAESAMDGARRAEVRGATHNLLGRIRSFFGLR